MVKTHRTLHVVGRGPRVRTRSGGARTRGGGRGLNPIAQRCRLVSPVPRRSRPKHVPVHHWTEVPEDPIIFPFTQTL